MGRSPLRTLDYKPRLDIDINLDVTAKTQKAQNIMKYIISYADIKFNTLVSNPRLLSFRFYPLIFLLLFCLSVYSYLLPNNTNKSFPQSNFHIHRSQAINQSTNKPTDPQQYQLSCELLSKYPPSAPVPLALREGPTRGWPGDVGRDVDRPASDKNGVVGSLMETSCGDMGDFSPWTSFS